MGLDLRKPSLVFANNKGTDQSAHPCNLLSAFVIYLMGSIRFRLATCEAGLTFALYETPKTGFVMTRPILE